MLRTMAGSASDERIPSRVRSLCQGKCCACCCADSVQGKLACTNNAKHRFGRLCNHPTTSNMPYHEQQRICKEDAGGPQRAGQHLSKHALSNAHVHSDKNTIAVIDAPRSDFTANIHLTVAENHAFAAMQSPPATRQQGECARLESGLGRCPNLKGVFWPRRGFICTHQRHHEGISNHYIPATSVSSMCLPAQRFCKPIWHSVLRCLQNCFERVHAKQGPGAPAPRREYGHQNVPQHAELQHTPARKDRAREWYAGRRERQQVV